MIDMIRNILKDTDGAIPVSRTVIVLVAVALVAGAVSGALLLALRHAGLGGASFVLLSALFGAALFAPLSWFAVVAPLRGPNGPRAAGGLPVAPPVAGSTPDNIDAVTRTLDRRGITIALLNLMALADRYRHELSIAMVDIDRLGQINAEHGNEAGDRVLGTIAGMLADALRMPDHVGRYSANEFLLILPETGLTAGRKLAERIRTAAADTGIDVDGRAVRTTISVGVTQFHPGEDLEQFVSRAEKAIRDAKAKGRNCVVCTDE
jgi:diguanylate cyclase (GGDEF)-like protein